MEHDPTFDFYTRAYITPRLTDVLSGFVSCSYEWRRREDFGGGSGGGGCGDTSHMCLLRRVQQSG